MTTEAFEYSTTSSAMPAVEELPETSTARQVGELFAAYIAAPASSMSPAAIAEHMQQNQITFEIPTAHDLRHIDALHTASIGSSGSSTFSSAASSGFSFNALLERITGAAAGAGGGSGAGLDTAAMAYDTFVSHHGYGYGQGQGAGSGITTEQLSKSVVLDLADLSEQASGNGTTVWQQIFGDADVHAIINYLWIGVVTSLVLLSLVFIIFSCYFYRKFRTWKKCNKDIRAQIHGSDSYATHGGNHLVGCESRLLPPSGLAMGIGLGAGVGVGVGVGVGPGGVSVADAVGEAAFYQIESPPCYTIATGLPSYDEALHHQPRHFAYAMKFMYPHSLAAVHHHHHHHHQQQQQQQQQQHAGGTSNWEKDELQQRQNKLQKCKLSTAEAKGSSAMPIAPAAAICINIPTDTETEAERERERESRQQEEQQQLRRSTGNIVALAATPTAMATSTAGTQSLLLPADAADDDCASLVVVVDA